MRHLIAVSLLLAGSVAMADDCEFQADRSFTVDRGEITALNVKTGRNDLRVQGEAGLAQIVVTAKACASDEEDLPKLKLTQRRDGTRLLIEAENPDSSGGILLFPGYADLDIQIRLPADLAVSVDAGSGDTTARDLASLDYDAGSGDLDADGIRDELRADVGSGDITANGVGRFALDSVGSGDIVVRDVRETVVIGSVGSGDVTLRKVGGSVQIGNVGSGDIDISGAAEVTIDGTGSGDIDVDDVRGNFTVKEAGSSDISYRNVGGTVDVPKDD